MVSELPLHELSSNTFELLSAISGLPIDAIWANDVDIPDVHRVEQTTVGDHSEILDAIRFLFTSE